MPYGNLDKRNDWFYACLFWVVAILVCAAIGGLVAVSDRKAYADGYRQGRKEWYGKGYTDGYKKASDDAVEVVDRQISEIENRLTNH